MTSITAKKNKGWPGKQQKWKKKYEWASKKNLGIQLIQHLFLQLFYLSDVEVQNITILYQNPKQYKKIEI